MAMLLKPLTALAGTRVLVTGGTGFIGSRLIARLVAEAGADVRVLVRNFARAPQIARYPIQMVGGDVAVGADVNRAMDGCQVVFHCAYGNQGSDSSRRSSTVDGSRNVVEAAIRHGVSRMIHVSTVAVYGDTPDGDLDESHPRRYTGSYYADNKIDAEKAVRELAAARGLPAVILQPTIVYGPYGSSWTGNVLQQLKTGRVILVNGGSGLCNAVYVDDVVTALLLAAVRDEAVGETFLISGGEPVTWREFYGRFERMLGATATVSMSAAEAERHYRASATRSSIIRESLQIFRDLPVIRERLLATREGALAARLARLAPRQLRQRLRGASNGASFDPPGLQHQKQPLLPIHPQHPSRVRFLASKTRVRTDKASHLLGFQPAFEMERGMRLTEQWARWANLV